MLFLWTKYEYTVEVFTLPKCKPDPPENCWAPETNSGIQWPFRGASPRPEHSDPYQKTKTLWPVCLAPLSLLLRAIRGVTPVPPHLCWCAARVGSRSPGAAGHTLCSLRAGHPHGPAAPNHSGNDISAQHWAATDGAYPNMLNWGHNGLD